MSFYVQVQWLCPHKEEAKEIAELLLERRWIACANMIERIESYYVWEGKKETFLEVEVLFKTKLEYFPKIEELILERGSYKVPCLICFPILDGHQPYFKWMDESLGLDS